MDRFRAVFGVGRSGTSWVSKVLASSSTPMRYFHEPFISLVRDIIPEQEQGALRPRFWTRERRGVGMYPILLQKNVPERLNRSFLRRDLSWDICLFKEVHGLLGILSIFSLLSCPTVLVLRDVARIIDSLYTRDGRNTSYLYLENLYLSDPHYIYMMTGLTPGQFSWVMYEIKRSGDFEMQRTLQLAFTIGAIQQSFYAVKKEDPDKVMLVQYESLCLDPGGVFEKIFDHMGIEFDNVARKFLEGTQLPVEEEVDHFHSIHRDTNRQLRKDFSVLTPQERSKIYNILEHLDQ